VNVKKLLVNEFSALCHFTGFNFLTEFTGLAGFFLNFLDGFDMSVQTSKTTGTKDLKRTD